MRTLEECLKQGGPWSPAECSNVSGYIGMLESQTEDQAARLEELETAIWYNMIDADIGGDKSELVIRFVSIWLLSPPNTIEVEK